MTRQWWLLCAIFSMGILAPAVAAGYDYTCEGEVDGRRGVSTIAMYNEGNGNFRGTHGNFALAVRREREELVMSFTPVQRPKAARIKRTHVPDGKDSPAQFTTRFRAGVLSITCK